MIMYYKKAILDEKPQSQKSVRKKLNLYDNFINLI